MDLKYPIGVFNVEGDITKEMIEGWIDEIEMAPQLLLDATKGLQEEQLDTPYRQDGWTIRQVVHHLADSHINSYTRFKLALTEEQPVIKPYQEDKWAELQDSKLSIEVSHVLLDALHSRWVYLLRTLKASDLEKTFFHPELGEMSLKVNIGLYAWHCRHHTAQITTLRKRLNW
jgi:uncharacterized damage-inducible protein DinB